MGIGKRWKGHVKWREKPHHYVSLAIGEARSRGMTPEKCADLLGYSYVDHGVFDDEEKTQWSAGFDFSAFDNTNDTELCSVATSHGDEDFTWNLGNEGAKSAFREALKRSLSLTECIELLSQP